MTVDRNEICRDCLRRHPLIPDAYRRHCSTEYQKNLCRFSSACPGQELLQWSAVEVITVE
ncbi:hypothetical protein [Victivallis sp. Marseille-Q1083]|uniref:hypothetical protein n=1 Tax=Victivallis sp. Marseille-Q1083 TaxID=2717288 RepID=UPI00158C0BD7|nr:hypothetical protein [Victivallis sp. Marseille-Q1083]